jgi:general secretion pathway protein I
MIASPSPVLRPRLELRPSNDPLSTRGCGLCRSTEEEGFSLVEALVALAILAIATVGLMRTVESHIDSTRGVERRTAAMWVAENRLAELEAKAPTSTDQVEMLGEQWRITATRRGTDDPEIQRVRIEVFPVQESSPLASLDGFVDGRKG